jgi:hypothetical protein
LGEATYRSRDLVEQIWHDVAVEAELATEPIAAAPPDFALLIHDEERQWINAHCELDTSPADLPQVGRLGSLKAGFKHRAATFVVAVLRRYFVEERELLAHMVRFQNNVATRHDELAAEVKRLHQQLPAELRRLWQRDALLFELLASRVAELEDEVEDLKKAPRST